MTAETLMKLLPIPQIGRTVARARRSLSTIIADAKSGRPAAGNLHIVPIDGAALEPAVCHVIGNGAARYVWGRSGRRGRTGGKGAYVFATGLRRSRAASVP
jgi:hypothetical protein